MGRTTMAVEGCGLAPSDQKGMAHILRAMITQRAAQYVAARSSRSRPRTADRFELMTAPFRHSVFTARHRGQRSAELLDALARRDELIRTAAARFLPEMSARSAAAALHAALARYSGLGWRRDRIEVKCPARHVGRITEWCWMILKMRDHVPSERVIRRALAA